MLDARKPYDGRLFLSLWQRWQKQKSEMGCGARSARLDIGRRRDRVC